MSSATLVQTKPLALEIHRLLQDLDPSRWRVEIEAAVREQAGQLRHALSDALEQSEVEASPQVSAHFRDIAAVLDAVPSEELPGEQLRDGWQQVRDQLQTAYEALRKALREHAVEIPTVRPTNYTRSIMHAMMAVGCVMLAEWLPNPWLWTVPLGAAVMAWSMEAGRQFHPAIRKFLLTVFAAVAHPHERYRVNSSTWFVTGLAVLALLLEPRLCAVAVAVLGFADPAAGLVGRRFGRTKLIKQRSLEGSLTFVAVGVLAGVAVLSAYHADMAWSARLAVATGASLAGAVAELFSGGRVDDNFSVPLGAGIGGWLALTLIG